MYIVLTATEDLSEYVLYMYVSTYMANKDDSDFNIFVYADVTAAMFISHYGFF